MLKVALGDEVAYIFFLDIYFVKVINRIIKQSISCGTV